MFELEKFLEKFMNASVFTPEGEIYFVKRRMDRVRNMKIEMYSNDHNPPHFHVNSSDKSINAVFSLYDCILIEGKINSADRKRIEEYHKFFKEKLIDYYNKNVIKQVNKENK